MGDDVEFFALLHLNKAGGEAVRFDVNVEAVERGGGTLGGQIGGFFREREEALHLIAVHQLAIVDPAFGTFRGADPVPAAALADNVEAFAVFNDGGGRGFRVDFAMKSEGGGACPGFPDNGTGFRRGGSAACEEEQEGDDGDAEVCSSADHSVASVTGKGGGKSVTLKGLQQHAGAVLGSW